MDNKLNLRDYQDAILVQSASNLSGVVNSFAKVIKKISNEGFVNNKGTDWINTHPICRLYAEQIHFLSSGDTSLSYYKAYNEITVKIKELEMKGK